MDVPLSSSLGEEAIRRLVAAQREGKTLEEALRSAAQWRVEASNAHRLQARWPNNILADPSVDLANKTIRGKWDSPTYEMLMERNAARGMTETEAQLRILNRVPNRKWTKVAKAGKIVGFVGIAIEAGSFALDVYDAEEGERVSVALKGAGRFTGSVAGGYAGFIAGAKIGGGR